MCCGNNGRVLTAVGIGIALGWVVLIGGGWLMGWMDGDEIAVSTAMAVATSGGMLATVSAAEKRKSRRDADGVI